MRYGSVCSGVEAATLAWSPLGWEAAFFSEIEPFPCAVLKARFPSVPNLGDMTQITVDSEGRIHGNGIVVEGGIDLLVGGTPCQSFSLAGRREGLAGASGLAFHFVRLLREIRPRFFVWENVPGALSSRTDGQFDFNFLIREYAECGYSLAWRVLDSQYVRTQHFPRAIPQRRRRVFVVGCLGDSEYPAQILFDGESMLGDPPPREGQRKDPSRRVGESPRGDSRGRFFDMRWPEASVGDAVPTLVASDYKGGKAVAENGGVCPTLEANLFNKNTFRDCGKFVEEESSPSSLHLNARDEAVQTEVPGALITVRRDRMQSYAVFKEDRSDSSGAKVYTLDSDASNSMKSINPHSGVHEDNVAKTLDTGVPTPSKNQGGQMILETVGEDLINGKETGGVASTLAAGSCATSSRNGPYVREVRNVIDMNGGKIGGRVSDGGVAPTIMNGHGDSHGVFENVDVYENHTLDGRVKEMPGVSPTLTSTMDRDETFNHPIVCEKAYAIAESMIGRSPKNGGNGIGAKEEVAYTQMAFGPQGVGYGSRIRRLMPVECERLMGFPDGHTVPVFKEITDDIVSEFVEIHYNWMRINSKRPDKVKRKLSKWVRKWLERISNPETCSDAFRYKVCGNSMCVNCMEWIGERIAEVDGRG